MKRRLLLIVLSLAGLIGVALSVLWLIPAILFFPSGSRAWKIVVTYDMLANAATGGDTGETISSRAYKAGLSGNRYGCIICQLLDWLHPNHCKNSVK